jgi:hypothetical protein
MRIRPARDLEARRGLAPHPEKAMGEAVVLFCQEVAQWLRLDAADDADRKVRDPNRHAHTVLEVAALADQLWQAPPAPLAGAA